MIKFSNLTKCILHFNLHNEIPDVLFKSTYLKNTCILQYIIHWTDS